MGLCMALQLYLYSWLFNASIMLFLSLWL
jgi:hypothetical protein